MIVVKGRKLVNAPTRAVPAACALYGMHVVEEWVERQPTRLHLLYIEKTPPGRIARIADLACRRGIAVKHADERTLTALAGTRRHQGVVGLASEFPYLPWEALLAAKLPTVLVLDQIQDPRNLGAILRTAAAIGGTGAVMPRDGSVSVTASVEAAAAGNAARVPVSRVTNLVRAVGQLQDAGYWALALDVREGACLFELEFASARTAIVVGGERGVRPLVRRSCDGLVHVPMPGGVESLNVSVATAIVLYELYRRGALKK